MSIQVGVESRLNDVRDVIVKGFLTCHVRAFGSEFILKSINGNELKEIKEISPVVSTRADALRYNLRYLAMSVYRIDGVNVLTQRPDRVDHLMSTFGKWPSVVISHMLRLAEGLSERYRDSFEDVKFWFAQNESRARWAAVKGCALSDPRVTGVMGTEALGLAEHQLIWALLQTAEDDWRRDVMVMSAGRMAATATNPKGMRSVNSQFEAKIASHDEQLKSLRDLVDPNKDNSRVKCPGTVKELLEELRKTEAGIKDEHDLVIEEFEKQVREGMDQKYKITPNAARSTVEVDGALLEPGTVVAADRRGVSESQMAELIMVARQRAATRAPVRLPVGVETPDMEQDGRAAKLYSILGGTIPAPEAN